MFLMLDVSDIAQDGHAFARQLLDTAGVSVLPGGGFGEQTRNFVRLSLTHGEARLAEAFDRIEQALAA